MKFLGMLPGISSCVSCLPTNGFFKYNFFYLFMFGCAGSSLLCRLFSGCGERRLLCGCGARASHCSGFPCGRAWGLGCAGFPLRRKKCHWLFERDELNLQIALGSIVIFTTLISFFFFFIIFIMCFFILFLNFT